MIIRSLRISTVLASTLIASAVTASAFAQSYGARPRGACMETPRVTYTPAPVQQLQQPMQVADQQSTARERKPARRSRGFGSPF
jgi:hypothetical protein